ncbi:MAG: hypothetical protein IT373_20685 [Polyangiaceae bacterium]|nr:hypothetical protein [Polyangiaceae bacterium]
MAEDPADLSADFDAWARLSAELGGLDAAERARRLGGAAAARSFAAAEALWGRRIAAEIHAGPSALAARYAAHCAAALESAAAPAVPQPSGEAAASLAPRTLQRARGPEDPSAELEHAPTQRKRRTATPHAPVPSSAPPELSRTGSGGAALEAMRDSIELAEAALRWPVEQYARLQAELAHRRDEQEVVVAVHGLDTRARRHVEEVWRRRLDGDPELATQYRRLFVYYRQVLERGAP